VYLAKYLEQTFSGHAFSGEEAIYILAEKRLKYGLSKYFSSSVRIIGGIDFIFFMVRYFPQFCTLFTNPQNTILLRGLPTTASYRVRIPANRLVARATLKFLTIPSASRVDVIYSNIGQILTFG